MQRWDTAVASSTWRRVDGEEEGRVNKELEEMRRRVDKSSRAAYGSALFFTF